LLNPSLIISPILTPLPFKNTSTNVYIIWKLCHVAAFNFDEQFILVSDASEFAGAGVLYQIPKGGEDFVINQLTNNNNNKNITSELYKKRQIKLIGFYSFKFDKSQLHYSMFDKELLSIIRTLEH